MNNYSIPSCLALCLLTVACSDTTSESMPSTMSDATVGAPDTGVTDAGNLFDIRMPTDILIDDPDRAIPPDGNVCPVCPGLQTCDPMTGECVEADTCEVNQDCLNERICEDGVCTDGCVVMGCPNDLTCDADSLTCVEASPCIDNAGCLSGRLCIQGQCSDACSMDADCEGQRTCDLNTGLCQEPTECASSIDCDLGRMCIERACADGCNDAQPCPGLQDCVAGLCNEPDVCSSDLDCLSDRLCTFGTCNDRCEMDADCPDARRCNVDTGSCLEPARCQLDADCDPNRICEDGTCVNGCTLTPCPNNLLCSDNRCRENEPCNGPQDCRPENACQPNGECQPRCTENADCADADTCDVGTGICVGESVDCFFDDQCEGEAVCRNGQCLTADCQSNDDCDAICSDNLCIDELPATCGPDILCPVGEACGPLGSCGPTTQCTNSTECDEAHPVCESGACYACIRDSDCFGSEICVAGQCNSVDFCVNDSDCRGNHQCQDSRCTRSACNGDRFDGPGTVTLPNAYHSNLVLCDSEIDTYRIQSQAERGVRVTLIADTAQHNLRLQIVSSTNPNLVYSESFGHNGRLQAGLVPTPAPVDAEIRITGQGGRNQGYALFVESIDATDCIADPVTTTLGNDFSEYAPLLWRASISGFLCGGDTDNYRLQLNGESTLTVDLDTDTLDGVELSLRTLDGQTIANGAVNEESRTFRVSYTTLTSTSVLLVVTLGPNADLREYQLAVALSDTPNTQSYTCDNQTQLSLGVPLLPARSWLTDSFEGSCNPQSNATEHAFAFNLTEASAVQVNLAPESRDYTAYIRSNCDDVTTERFCQSGESQMTTGILPAGAYTLFVESLDSTIPQITITAQP